MRRNDKIIAVLSKEGRDELVRALGAKGFVVSSQGHVDVENPKRNHPRFSDNPLPVAYIGKAEYYVQLVNTGERALRKYHKQIEKI